MQVKTFITSLAVLAAISFSPAFAQMDADMPDHPEALGQGMQPPPPSGPGAMACPMMPGPGACPMMGGHHHGWGPDSMGDLRLTDEQYEKLYQVHRAQMAKTTGTRNELMQAELDLHDQMLTANPDKAKIMATAKRIADLRSTLEMAKVETSLDTLSLLTPDQRMQLRKGMLHKFANHCPMLHTHD